jgi:hypothetical protein
MFLDMEAIGDLLLGLLTDLPCGEFLVEDQGEWRVLWRISEGASRRMRRSSQRLTGRCC